jgi:outer membrane protein assembly factor BamB
VWRKIVSATYGVSNAAYDGGSIFVITFDGTLLAYKASTGKPLWTVNLPYEYSFNAAPAARAGRVFVGGAGSARVVYSVNGTTGALEWAQSVDGGEVSPAVGPAGVYANYPCQQYGFNRSSGTVLWHVDLGCDGGGTSAPVYFADRVYFRDPTKGGQIRNASSGVNEGSFSSGTPPVLFSEEGSKSYMITGPGFISCFDLHSGKRLWGYSGGGVVNPIVVNDLVILGTKAGDLLALDRSSGELLWSTNVGAPFTDSNEKLNRPWTGFGAAEGVLVAPASNLLTAFVSNGAWLAPVERLSPAEKPKVRTANNPASAD